MILWSHRGYTNKESEENTITSLKKAYNKGYRNIEFDIWYKKGDLILKHDKPARKELKKEELTTLKNYLSVHKNKMHYWMDFKNLSKINIGKALDRLKQIIEELEINQKQIHFTPYETNWRKSISLNKKALKKFPKINIMLIQDEKSFKKNRIKKYAKTLQNNNIKFLSIHHDCVDKKLVETLKNVTLFAWTINEKEEYNRLKKLGIKNICTDKIIYANI